jgi:hypothetical protein
VKKRDFDRQFLIGTYLGNDAVLEMIQKSVMRKRNPNLYINMEKQNLGTYFTVRDD